MRSALCAAAATGPIRTAVVEEAFALRAIAMTNVLQMIRCPAAGQARDRAAVGSDGVAEAGFGGIQIAGQQCGTSVTKQRQGLELRDSKGGGRR